MICPVLIINEEDWIVAKDCETNVASQGKTVKEAMDNLKEALELYYEDNEVEKDTPDIFLTTMEVNV
ncbi:MAG: type II toxin-antitoxin system HicB family antitoxin [Lachnospiraceae bacterium]|nr:type II toxin-antitoxin system HicB family antitoxin [Lachnospiraceae bacterium]MEE3460350.1 type II toxin-antitoxin system HicB family antitoxin [Lachnospiraceae bacterium]